MKLYCLSGDSAKPCYVLSFRGLLVMLDCGLSAHTALNFLPLPLIPSSRLAGLASWVPRDSCDPLIEGELRECCGRVFVDSAPEFCPPLDKIIDFSQIDVILISNYLCMMALPFITEGTGFQGTVYATEPTLQISRFFMEEMVEFLERTPVATTSGHWKEAIHMLPPPLGDALKPRSWKHFYNSEAISASLARVQMVGYDEKLDIFGALQAVAVSSGYCLGSSNWVLASDHEKVAYVSGSSTLTTHPRPINQGALKGADLLILSGLTQTPTANPDSMLGELCVTVAMTLRAGGSVLIPCYPSGVVYDLFECLSGHLDNSGLSQVPLLFVSHVADSSLAYSNILAEWLSAAKQNKVYLPDEPFPHASLVRTSRLKHFRSIHQDGFSQDFRQPCVVFCGHPSLRFGDSVHFIELWGSNPLHTVVFTEPDFPYLDALAPFQPLAMKAVHCPIDTALNFSQANKLIRDLKPAALAVPEHYTVPPITAPHRLDLIIEPPQDRPLLCFKRGEVLRLPLKRKCGRAFMSSEAAGSIVPIEIRPKLSMSSMTACLQIKDNLHDIEALKDTPNAAENQGPNQESVLSKVKYEWGTLDIEDFLQRLTQEGITDAKVERNANGCIIHLQSADTLIQLEERSTHILTSCPDPTSLRAKLRDILMQCLATV